MDKRIFTGIFELTTNILKNHFFYDTESIRSFQDEYTMKIANEYCLFEQQTDEDFIRRLKSDLMGRKYFTSYFMSYHLHDILVENLHFTEQELDLFENLLPKIVGEQNVKYKGHERTNY